MMEVIHKLTPEQRRFALYSTMSLLAVGIMIFLINGLSDVSFTVDRSAQILQEKQKSEVAALEEILYQEYYRDAFNTKAVETFGTSSIFGQVATTRTLYVRDVTDFVHNRQHDIVQPDIDMANITVADTLEVACEEAVVLEEAAIDRYTDQMEQVGVNPEVVTVLRVLREQARDVYIPEFERCSE